MACVARCGEDHVGVGTDWIISAIAVSDAYREWSRAEFGTGARAPRSCITRGFREGCTEDRWKRFLSCLASTKISGGDMDHCRSDDPTVLLPHCSSTGCLRGLRSRHYGPAFHSSCGYESLLRTWPTAGADRKIFRSGSSSGNEFASWRIVPRLTVRWARADSEFPDSSSM
jgi:hypothetical protein